MQTGLATPASRDALLAGCVKALTQLQWGFDGHSSCLGELYCGLAQLFAADQPAEPSAGASDRYGFEAAALQSHFVPLLSADLAADGEKNTTGRPTKAATRHNTELRKKRRGRGVGGRKGKQNSKEKVKNVLLTWFLLARG